jgi:hypothetical protein
VVCEYCNNEIQAVYGPLILRFSSCHNTWFPSTACCVSFLQIRLPKAHAEIRVKIGHVRRSCFDGQVCCLENKRHGYEKGELSVSRHTCLNHKHA